MMNRKQGSTDSEDNATYVIFVGGMDGLTPRWAKIKIASGAWRTNTKCTCCTSRDKMPRSNNSFIFSSLVWIIADTEAHEVLPRYAFLHIKILYLTSFSILHEAVPHKAEDQVPEPASTGINLV